MNTMATAMATAPGRGTMTSDVGPEVVRSPIMAPNSPRATRAESSASFSAPATGPPGLRALIPSPRRRGRAGRWA
jgi:hypothetical protein